MRTTTTRERRLAADSENGKRALSVNGLVFRTTPRQIIQYYVMSPPSEPIPALSFWDRARSRFLTGALSGTFVSALTQPLDVIKTTQQSHRMGSDVSVRSSARVAFDIYSTKGVSGLYAGIGATVFRVFFGAGIYFASLHAMTDALGGGTAGAFAAGATARAMSVALLAPISVLKTRLESHGVERGVPIRGLGEWKALAMLSRTEGAASLFSGLVPTLVRDAPFSGLYVAAYSALRAWAGLGDAAATGGRARDGAAYDGWTRHVSVFLCGAGAAVFATTMTHPADVLKTRLQLRPAVGRFVDGSVIVAEGRALWEQQGLAGFFSGFGARISKRALSTALTWTLFEEGMRER